MLPYDYDRFSKYYDILDSAPNDVLNPFMAKVLREHHARKVADFTCGTGAQALWLAKRGFDVTGSDLSSGMLRLARERARKEGIMVRLYQRDVRNVKLGTFDAAITMFNAIGHLSKPEFEVAMRNIGRNLRKGGLYIFDIFNLDLMKVRFRTYMFIDLAVEVDETMFVRFNKNTLDRKNGIMHINQETIIQDRYKRPRELRENWTMQIYTADGLKRLLKRNGFEVAGQYAIDGTKFSRSRSSSILTVSRKA